MAHQPKLTEIPIINFNREDPEFRSKLLNFLLENSIEFDRNFIEDSENLKPEKNGSFNAMIRIFNIKKNSLTPKKYPQQIRNSIYQNLFAHKVDEKKREKIKKAKESKSKVKPKKKIINELKVEQPKPKKFREIRPSVYSHLIKRASVRSDSKNFEELNKIFKTPQKKSNSPRKNSYSEEKSSQNDSIDKQIKKGKNNLSPVNIKDSERKEKSKSSNNSNSPKKDKKYDNDQNSEHIKLNNKSTNSNENKKNSEIQKKNQTSPKTEIKSKNPKEQKNKDQDEIATEKKKMNEKPHQKSIPKPKPYNNNPTSDNSSIEIPSMNISGLNKINDDALNKTYEFKKSDYSFNMANSDEELKELCEKIKPKSGFHENRASENHQPTHEESDSFKKTMPFLEESVPKNSSFESSRNNNPQTDVDNKELVEKLDKALKVLESQKGKNVNNGKSIEVKFDEEFVNTLKKNSGEFEKDDKNMTPESLNRNFEKIVDRFFVGMEFLSTQELLYYYKFIVNRAKILYIKFLKTRGFINKNK